jgi:L-alanine-DL-glutamate epimerase-like enolase superfamily enzyme
LKPGGLTSPVVIDSVRFLKKGERQSGPHGLALWRPQAWVEFAILDMLGRIAGKPMGALFGDVVRREVPF